MLYENNLFLTVYKVCVIRKIYAQWRLLTDDALSPILSLTYIHTTKQNNFKENKEISYFLLSQTGKRSDIGIPPPNSKSLCVV